MTDEQKKTPTWSVRKPLSKAATLEKLNELAAATYACAKATTEESVRAGFMDKCHVLREAARLLG